jgi:hypothetical protein
VSVIKWKIYKPLWPAARHNTLPCGSTFFWAAGPLKRNFKMEITNEFLEKIKIERSLQSAILNLAALASAVRDIQIKLGMTKPEKTDGGE